MNDELQNKLKGKVDNLLISTTDNHFVNIKPGGFNPYLILTAFYLQQIKFLMKL